MTMGSTKVCLIVFFAIFQIGSSLKCINCIGKDECAKNASLICGPTDDHCLKVDNAKGDAALKKCGTVAECQLYAYCYSCQNENDCNSSSIISPPSFIIMALIGAIAVRYYI